MKREKVRANSQGEKLAEGKGKVVECSLFAKL